MTVLQTARLILREFQPSDDEALLGVFADPEAQRLFGFMATRDDAARWIAKNQARYEEFGFGLWAACLRTTGELIGDAGLTYQSLDGTRALEVAYHLRASSRRLGFGIEMARACLDAGFERTDAEEIVSIVHPDNAPSHALATRLHAAVRRGQRRGEEHAVYYTSRAAWASGDPRP